MEAFES